MINSISSSDNSRVRHIVKLQKSAKERRETGLFTVEGTRICREVPLEDLEELWISDSWKEDAGTAPLLEAAVGGNQLFRAPENIMKKMAGTEHPQGILAVVRQKKTEPEALLQGLSGANPFFLCLENIQDPGNLGTMIRTAEAAGVNGILISENAADYTSPKAVRATMGAVFRQKIAVAKSRDDFLKALQAVRKAGISLYAAHLAGADFYDADFSGPVAFLIGNEGNGLSEEVSALADRKIRIPMQGKTESLNASISAAVLCYEVLRQRRKN